MSEIIRKSNAVWEGDLKSGGGRISSGSNVLNEVSYSFATRFEDRPGTNPEELIAAAHAGCYAMAFSDTLAQKGYTPQSIEVTAACVMEKQGGDFAITKMRLQVKGSVEKIDEDTFLAIAKEADKECPVSNLLRPGLKIELETKLI